MDRSRLVTLGLPLFLGCSPQGADPATDDPPVVERTPHLAAATRGFPALRDLDGQALATGNYAQWMENDRLHISIRYDYGGGTRTEELAVFRLAAQPIQDEWRWDELRDGQPFRRFEVDFGAGVATAEKREGEETNRWSEEIDVEPGRTYAGFGFTVALKALRERLIEGETVELEAVAFRPRPRVLGVEVSHAGVDQMRMAGRVVQGDRFEIRPKIPWIVELFIDVPDIRLWLTHPPPAEFLRFEGPLMEPGDEVVRIDLLPGGPSGAAEPVQAQNER